MIEPLEAILNHAKADTVLATLVSNQIDDRHHYGQDSGDWAQNSQALILTPVGGASYIDGHVHRFQLDARCYGDTLYEAGAVYKALRALSKKARRVVTTASGDALIYYFVFRGDMRRIIDDEIRPNGGMPGYQVICEAMVAEEDVI